MQVQLQKKVVSIVERPKTFQTLVIPLGLKEQSSEFQVNIPNLS